MSSIVSTPDAEAVRVLDSKLLLDLPPRAQLGQLPTDGPAVMGGLHCTGTDKFLAYGMVLSRVSSTIVLPEVAKKSADWFMSCGTVKLPNGMTCEPTDLVAAKDFTCHSVVVGDTLVRVISAQDVLCLVKHDSELWNRLRSMYDVVTKPTD